MKDRLAVPSLLPIAAVLLSTGCVHVRTPDVDVRVNQFEVPSRSSNAQDASVRYMPYAAALRRVIKQQDDVLEALHDHDWEDLSEEADEWRSDARRLNGYADTSHDPAMFRRECDELLRGIQLLRREAARRDASACTRALDACDPVLDRLSRTFPLTETVPGQATPPARADDQRPTQERP